MQKGLRHHQNTRSFHLLQIADSGALHLDRLLHALQEQRRCICSPGPWNTYQQGWNTLSSCRS